MFGGSYIVHIGEVTYKAVLDLLLCTLLVPTVSASSTHRTYTPRASSGYRSGTRSSPAPRASASRPYYGGGHHTTSHGGRYPGETNAHHKHGHYQNWRTGDSYGGHQAR
jgi:hypothetical protein